MLLAVVNFHFGGTIEWMLDEERMIGRTYIVGPILRRHRPSRRSLDHRVAPALMRRQHCCREERRGERTKGKERQRKYRMLISNDGAALQQSAPTTRVY